MTPDEFKQARRKLGLTQAELGHVLNADPVTIRRWEAAPEASMARPPNPVACRALGWLLAGYRPPEWPEGKG
jgi:DNA-binding transcriptional regulator YiaG